MNIHYIVSCVKRGHNLLPNDFDINATIYINKLKTNNELVEFINLSFKEIDIDCLSRVINIICKLHNDWVILQEILDNLININHWVQGKSTFSMRETMRDLLLKALKDNQYHLFHKYLNNNTINFEHIASRYKIDIPAAESNNMAIFELFCKRTRLINVEIICHIIRTCKNAVKKINIYLKNIEPSNIYDYNGLIAIAAYESNDENIIKSIKNLKNSKLKAIYNKDYRNLSVLINIFNAIEDDLIINKLFVLNNLLRNYLIQKYPKEKIIEIYGRSSNTGWMTVETLINLLQKPIDITNIKPDRKFYNKNSRLLIKRVLNYKEILEECVKVARNKRIANVYGLTNLEMFKRHNDIKFSSNYLMLQVMTSNELIDDLNNEEKQEFMEGFGTYDMDNIIESYLY